MSNDGEGTGISTTMRWPATDSGCVGGPGPAVKDQLPCNDSRKVDAADQSTVFAASVFGRSHLEELDSHNVRMERNSIFLLVALGIVAGLVNGLILYANSQLCSFQAWIITGHGKNYGIGLLYFLLSTCGFVGIASLLCSTFASSAAGSGLPEFKSLLARSDLKSRDYRRLVSGKVLCVKTVGLIFSVGSCLSVGTEGPLVHVAACVAHLLMRHVYEFELILQSPNIVKQIFAASAAVGISSAFNAPIGGLLFSVEATTTFYLISNYWKSCVAAASGAAATYLILTDEPLQLLQMSSNAAGYAKWELIVFLLMGIAGGYGATLFLYLHQRVNLLFRPINRERPVLLAIAVGLATAFLIFVSGSYTDSSVGIIALVKDSLNAGHVVEMQRVAGDVEPLGGVLATLLIRTVLTLAGTNLLLPAGIFMPVFLLGSLFGRFVGGLVQLGVPSAVVPSYALVGAVAFSAGVTQTVSVTMIAVEMTGNINLLLPLLIVSVVGAGISKMNGLSIYDQGMLNKGLESFQLLLTETCGYKYAMEIMSVSMRSLSRETDVRRLLKVLEMVGQSVFPVVDEGGDFLGNKLIGTLSRREVFKRVQKAFEQAGAEEALRVLLPGDCKDDDEIKDAALEMEKKRRKREELRETVNATMSRTEALASRLLFDDGDAALDSKSSRARCTADAIPIETTYSPLVSQQQHEVDVEKGSRLWDAVDATARGVVRDIRRRSVNTEAPSSGDNGLDSELLLAGADGRLEELLGQSVDISTDAEFELNTYPYSITPLTPMEHVYVLFEMVKASAIFVLEDGKLRGMITPEGLLNALKEKASV